MRKRNMRGYQETTPCPLSHCTAIAFVGWPTDNFRWWLIEDPIWAHRARSTAYCKAKTAGGTVALTIRRAAPNRVR